MNERRLGQRSKAKLPAQVIDPPGCRQGVMIIDISGSGARLELSWGASLPSRFTLRIKKENRDLLVDLVWRDSFYAGVRFVRADERIETRAPRRDECSKRLSPAELRQIAGIRS